MKRILALLLGLLLLLSVCSCSGAGGKGGSSDGAGNGEYVDPKLDFGGRDILIANQEARQKMHMLFVIDAEETDDTLNAAIWESNQRVQQKFNFTLKEDLFPQGTWEEMWTDHAVYLLRNFMSGDDVFDVVFYAPNQYPDLINNGYLYDLSDFEQLHLDQPWWDTQLNEDLTINDRLYMSSGPINLMAYDSMACLVFNKDIILANQLEMPYDIVREGKWTIDKLNELATECKNQGSDPHWWILTGQGGTSVYGIGMHRDFPSSFLTSAGISFLSEKDGEYDLAVGTTDDFYLALDKLKPLFTHCEQGGSAGGDCSGSANNIRAYFREGRAAFCMVSTIEAFGLRDSEIDFGFLPLPKLNEEQETYITDVMERTSFVCIPTASSDPENVASMLDALAYDRYKNVVPVYYDSYITYKGVRDEESLEMLEIMTEGRTMNPGIAYGLCLELVVQDISWNFPSDSIASLIASKESTVNDYIDEFIANNFN